MKNKGTEAPDASAVLSRGSGTEYVGQHVGSRRLILVLFTPLVLSSSLIFLREFSGPSSGPRQLS